jgi:hypothetical protein
MSFGIETRVTAITPMFSVSATIDSLGHYPFTQNLSVLLSIFNARTDARQLRAVVT